MTWRDFLKAEQLSLFRRAPSTIRAAGEHARAHLEQVRQEVMKPGSRGGQYWIDERGHVRYDPRPTAQTAQPPPVPPAAPPHQPAPPATPPAAPPPDEPPDMPDLPDAVIGAVQTLRDWKPTPFGRTPNAIDWARQTIAREYQLFGGDAPLEWRKRAEEKARELYAIVPIPEYTPPRAEFNIAERKWDGLLAKLERINRRAKRLKLPPIEYEIVGEPFFRPILNKFGKPTSAKEKFFLVRVAGDMPRLPDWQFWATLQHLRDEDGHVMNIVRAVPSPEGEINPIPEEYRTRGAFCDHCKTKRDRVDTFLLRNVQTGEFKQIGRNCLQDFVGKGDVEGVAAAAEMRSLWMLELQEADSGDFEDEEPGYEERDRAPRYFDLDDFLAATAASIRVSGWRSRKEEASTVDEVFRILFPPKKEKPPVDVLDEDKAVAAAALEWVQGPEFTGDKVPNDYQWNLLTASKLGMVLPKTAGIMASLIAAYQRMRGDVIRREKEKLTSKHFGEIGKRAVHTISITGIIPRDTMYGTTYITKFVDSEGNQGTWFASRRHEMEIGETWEVKATIKKHDEFRGVPQTTVARLVPIKKVGDVAKASWFRRLLLKAQQLALFGAPAKEVQEPGSHGGKFYVTPKGKVRYGERPQLDPKSWAATSFSDLNRQGFMRNAYPDYNFDGTLKKKKAPPKPKPPIVACDRCQDWHREGQHHPGSKPPPLNPKPREKTSAGPQRPVSERWEADRGAMPGEPIMYLDVPKDGGYEDARAVIVEHEDENANVLYEALDAEGKSLGVYPSVEEAAARAEFLIRPIKPGLIPFVKGWLGGHHEIQAPGSRGGRFWWSKRGKVEYGDKPQPTAPAASPEADDYKRNGTRAKAFKAWFGDWESTPATASKVVDDKGEPQQQHKIKVVFHGTSHGGFTKFDPQKGQPALFGRGFYFTESETMAREYATTKDVDPQAKPEIKACYLNIRNPFVVDRLIGGKLTPEPLDEETTKALRGVLAAHPDAPVRQLGEELYLIPDAHAAFKKIASIAGGEDAAATLLRKAGYDGITHTGGRHSNAPKHRVWIAFKPTQIKAVENAGTFDANDADILKADVKAPGSRGGRYWITKRGTVRYGQPPKPRLQAAIDANVIPHTTPSVFIDLAGRHIGAGGMDAHGNVLDDIREKAGLPFDLNNYSERFDTERAAKLIQWARTEELDHYFVIDPTVGTVEEATRAIRAALKGYSPRPVFLHVGDEKVGVGDGFDITGSVFGGNVSPTRIMPDPLRNSGSYGGRPFWSGVVDVRDGEILEVHTYEEAEEAGFHHSHYVTPTSQMLMREGLARFFWMDRGGGYRADPTWPREQQGSISFDGMAPVKPGLITRIREQLDKPVGKARDPIAPGSRGGQFRVAPSGRISYHRLGQLMHAQRWGSPAARDAANVELAAHQPNLPSTPEGWEEYIASEDRSWATGQCTDCGGHSVMRPGGKRCPGCGGTLRQTAGQLTAEEAEHHVMHKSVQAAKPGRFSLRRLALVLKAAQLAFFGLAPRQEVQAPGARGSTKWWIDHTGHVRYDPRPPAPKPTQLALVPQAQPAKIVTVPMPTVYPDLKAAEKLRNVADALGDKIEYQHSPGILSQNPTARRARIGSYMVQEGDRLEGVQSILYALADLHAEGTVPPILRTVRTRAMVEELDSGRRQSSQRYGGRAGETWSRWPHAVVHGLRELGELKEKLKGKRVPADVRETLRKIELRGPVENRDYYLLAGLQEITAVEIAAKIARGAHTSKWGNVGSHILENLKDAKRAYLHGFDTEEKWDAAAEALHALKKVVDRSSVRNLQAEERKLIGQKIAGYFPTPKSTVEHLLELADIRPGMKVLEPSAGKGNIADVIRAQHPDAPLTVLEWNSQLRGILALKGYTVAGTDFLEHTEQYARVIQNPPFENGQDVDHVLHAYDLLAPGGRLVSIMGEHAFFAEDKKSQAFRAWLDEHGATFEKLPAGSFLSSERPTGVNCRVIVVDKPALVMVKARTDRNRPKMRELLTERERINRDLFYLEDEDMPAADATMMPLIQTRRRHLKRRLAETSANIDALRTGGVPT